MFKVNSPPPWNLSGRPWGTLEYIYFCWWGGGGGGVYVEEKRSVSCVIPPCRLTVDQREVLEVVERGHNVFITGQAGTGKSFLVKEIFWSLSRKGTKCEIMIVPVGLQEQLMEISPQQCPQSILFMVCKPRICRGEMLIAQLLVIKFGIK